MNLSLRPAEDSELAASESLSRRNMASYRVARGIAWDPERFRSSWHEFENLAIVDGSQRLGFVRLLPERDSLVIRDLQVLRKHQGRGVGSWAISQVKQIAASRGYMAVELRVFPENPAMTLYSRLGFVAQRVEGTIMHMRCCVAPDPSPC